MINYGEFLPGYILVKIETTDRKYEPAHRDKYWIAINEFFSYDDLDIVSCLGNELVEEKNVFINEMGEDLAHNHLFWTHPKEGYHLVQAALTVEPDLLKNTLFEEWLIDRAARLVKLQLLK